MQPQKARDILLGTLTLIFLALSAFAAYEQNRHANKPSPDLSVVVSTSTEESDTTPTPSSPKPTILGKRASVTRVVDGDTIEVSIDGRIDRVRYIGVDTPESVHPEVPVECYGPEASLANKKLVEGKEVVLVPDITDRDKYGRLLRYVYVDDTFVNLYLLEQGYAQVVTYPPDVAHVNEYRVAQTTAREAKRGLWGKCIGDGTIVPRDYSDGVESAPPAGCVIKGNINTDEEKIYHLPSCEYYSKTSIDPKRGERWFCSEAEALEAGFRKAGNCK